MAEWSLHQVSLTCVFDERQFDCGTTFLSTAPPALVVGDKVTFINITSKMTQSCQVYTQMGVARSWGESREECRFVAIQEEVFCDFLSMS